MTGPTPRPGPRGHPGRGNGLVAGSYAALGEIDPRTADAVLRALADAGIAAYVKPSTGTLGGYLDVRLPARPVDRLFVDAERRREARAVLDAELTETAELPVGGGRGRAEDAAFAELVAHWDDPVLDRSWPEAEDVTPADGAPFALFTDPSAFTDPTGRPGTAEDETGVEERQDGRPWPIRPPRPDRMWEDPIGPDAEGAEDGGTQPLAWWAAPAEADGADGADRADGAGQEDEDGAEPIADLRGTGPRRRDTISGGPGVDRFAEDPSYDTSYDASYEGAYEGAYEPYDDELGPIDDEEHYEPPPPPPLPRIQPATKWAILSMVFGLLLLVAPAVLGLDDSTAVHAVAVLCVLGGAASLVLRMRDVPRGPDDGAVV